MNEFDFIATHLRPLATAPEAQGLLDDGACLPPLPSGKEWRLTSDTLVEGVHFPDGASWETRIHRLFAANVSDLNAQLAAPQFYSLNLSLKPGFDPEALAGQLATCQQQFGLRLLGGDTTQTAGPTVLTMTAFGLGDQGMSPLRSQAKVGDGVYLLPARHGPLGAAKAGFEGLEAFHAAFHRPQLPAMDWVPSERSKIHALTDVSDGLVQDLGQICLASQVAAEVWLDRLPVALPDQPKLPQITWGDDQALVLTAAAPPLINGLVEIGRIKQGQGVRLLDSAGREITVERPGYKHL